MEVKMNRNLFSQEVLILGFLFFASYEIQAARPLFTDHAETIEKETSELEIGYSIFDSQNHRLNIFLKYGLSERVDFGIDFPYEIKPVRGLYWPDFKIKFSILEEKDNQPGISTLVSFDFPSLVYHLDGIVTKEFSPITVHLNVGFITNILTTGQEGTLTYSGAIEYMTWEKLNLAVELLGRRFYGMSSLDGLIGLNYQVFDKLVLDFAGYKGFIEQSTDWRFTFGITYGF